MSKRLYIRHGGLCGEKVKFKDGISYCIWHPFEGDEDTGVCWDFAEEEFDDLIQLLMKLNVAEPVVYIENDND